MADCDSASLIAKAAAVMQVGRPVARARSDTRAVRVAFARLGGACCSRKEITGQHTPRKDSITLVGDKKLARELSIRLDGNFTTHSVARLRRAGVIPYLKLGYRTLKYDAIASNRSS